MRIVTMIILCFTLAFANVSHAHNYDMDCPMEQDHSDTMPMSMAVPADCCNDVDTAAITGELCKPEQSCHASPTVLIFSVPSVTFISSDRGIKPNVSDAVPHLTLNTLWRPPTLS